MPKTNFIDGITAVSAAFLNKIFTHVHDGNDQDGSAPKIDPTYHIDWSDDVTISGGSGHTITHGGTASKIVSAELHANTDVKIGGDSIKPRLAQMTARAVVARNGGGSAGILADGHNLGSYTVQSDHIALTPTDASAVLGVAVGASSLDVGDGDPGTTPVPVLCSVEWTAGVVRIYLHTIAGVNIIDSAADFGVTVCVTLY